MYLELMLMNNAIIFAFAKIAFFHCIFWLSYVFSLLKVFNPDGTTLQDECPECMNPISFDYLLNAHKRMENGKEKKQIESYFMDKLMY